MPVALLPPATVLGDIESDATETGAVTVRVADTLELPSAAVIVAVLVVDGTVVMTGKVMDVCPAATLTLAPT